NSSASVPASHTHHSTVCDMTVFHSPTTLLFISPASTSSESYSLPLHDALPICTSPARRAWSTTRSCTTRTSPCSSPRFLSCSCRSEEHTSELQSRFEIVCRLLLEKKKLRQDIHLEEMYGRKDGCVDDLHQHEVE